MAKRWNFWYVEILFRWLSPRFIEIKRLLCTSRLREKFESDCLKYLGMWFIKLLSLWSYHRSIKWISLVKSSTLISRVKTLVCNHIRTYPTRRYILSLIMGRKILCNSRKIPTCIKRLILWSYSLRSCLTYQIKGWW